MQGRLTFAVPQGATGTLDCIHEETIYGTQGNGRGDGTGTRENIHLPGKTAATGNRRQKQERQRRQVSGFVGKRKDTQE